MKKVYWYYSAKQHLPCYELLVQYEGFRYLYGTSLSMLPRQKKLNNQAFEVPHFSGESETDPPWHV